MQLTIEKFGCEEAPGPFLGFHDKGPGVDNTNVMITIFSESVALSLLFLFPNFHWILISGGSGVVHGKKTLKRSLRPSMLRKRPKLVNYILPIILYLLQTKCGMILISKS